MVYIMPRLSLPSRLVPHVPSYYMGVMRVNFYPLPLDHVAKWHFFLLYWPLWLALDH